MSQQKKLGVFASLSFLAMLQLSCSAPEMRQEKIIFENDFEIPDTNNSKKTKGKTITPEKPGHSTMEKFSEEDLKSFFPNWTNLNLLEESQTAYSGTHICKLDSTREYSVTFNKKINSINIGKADFADLTWMVKRNGESTPLILVFSIESNDSIIQYESMNISPAIKSTGVWEKISTSFLINYFDQKSSVKCYLWNQGKGSWEIDDFKLEFILEFK